jgi:hypothetical protein
MKLSPFSFLLLAVVPVFHAPPAAAENTTAALADRTDLRLAVYNGDTALVSDTRAVTLAAGKQTVTFNDLSRQLQAETALLQSAPGVAVLDQTALGGTLSPTTLLRQFTGQKVLAVRVNPATGAETREEATLLSTNGGIVLRIGDRIETQFPGRIVFPSVPPNLLADEALAFTLTAAKAGRENLELTYLTRGIGWKADYVLQLAPSNLQFAITGLATVSNQSGTSFPAAKLQLVAGQVNREPQDRMMPFRKGMAAMALDEAAPAYPPQTSQQGLADYYAYTVETPVTLGEGESKQISFLSSAEVKSAKKYVLASNDLVQPYQEFGEPRKLHPVATLVFQNSKESNLGKPIPAGVARVYQKNTQGNNFFIGEAAIEHTPVNEEVKVTLGEAFDVTARKTQVAFERIPRKINDGRQGEIVEKEFSIDFQSAKPEKTVVEVREQIAGEWELISASRPGKRESANTAVWTVEIPANGKTSLQYRIRVRYF